MPAGSDGATVALAAALESTDGDILVMTASLVSLLRRVSVLPPLVRTDFLQRATIVNYMGLARDSTFLPAMWPGRIVLDDFERCGEEKWGPAALAILDRFRGIPTAGLSQLPLRLSKDNLTWGRSSSRATTQLI